MKAVPLVLDPAPRGAWVDLQRGGRAPLPRSAPAAVTLTHWRRSLELGAPRRAPGVDDLIRRGPELLERVERLDPVLACGRRVLERVAAAAGRSDHRLLFADAEGVIVHAEGGGGFDAHARRVRLLEGACWSEADRGTNAIGTALATGKPVFVRGGAHYVEDYRDLVCYAAPVRDPDGALVGALDVTSFQANEDPSLRAGVLAAARALEEVLRLAAWSRAGDAVHRAVARSLDRMGCPVAVIEPPGRITRANDAARALFAGRAVDELESWAGLGFAAAAASARDGVGPAPEVTSGDGRRYRVRFEPIESGARALALLAFFEPVAGAAAGLAGAPAPARADFAGFFAADPETRRALDWAARVAPSEVPVMLLAETDAGKELVARGVHAASRRAAGPFVAVNCGAIEPTLLASELFGYGGGAFTGAERGGRDGYLHAADGGTLFLDEVADTPPAMQAALLRVLESGEYQRVGETRPRRVDVRVICATCADLDARVVDGRFRRDLYFRLKGALVTLPPVRVRADLRALCDHLLAERSRAGGRAVAPRVGDAAFALLAAHPWPGNVRELVTTLEVALVLAGEAATIGPEHLPPGFGRPDPSPSPAPGTGAATRSDAEGRALRRALDDHAGNLSAAARQLGVARSTLYRMLRRHGLVAQGRGPSGARA